MKERKTIKEQPGVFIKFLSADTPLHPSGLQEAFGFLPNHIANVWLHGGQFSMNVVWDKDWTFVQ